MADLVSFPLIFSPSLFTLSQILLALALSRPRILLLFACCCSGPCSPFSCCGGEACSSFACAVPCCTPSAPGSPDEDSVVAFSCFLTSGNPPEDLDLGCFRDDVALGSSSKASKSVGRVCLLSIGRPTMLVGDGTAHVPFKFSIPRPYGEVPADFGPPWPGPS